MTAPAATPLAVSRPMPGWLKGGLLAAFVIGVCWGGAIWYWRAKDIEPAGSEMMLLLLAAPLALLLVLGLGSKLVALRAASPAAAPQAKPAPATSAPQPVRPLAIVATSVRSPHGASVEELSAAIAANKARADLDADLLDPDGFPVMTARSADAFDEALKEDITEWLANNGMPDLRFSDEQWRALTLATGVAGDLAGRAASDLIPADGVAPMLRLIPVLPTEWDADQRRAGGMWLTHTVMQFGWPPAHISLVEDMPAEGLGIRPLSALMQLRHEAPAGNARSAAMVIACASCIGQETVNEWAASGSLFTSSRPQGLIPGEGAAGLLITSLHDGMEIENATLVLTDPAGDDRSDSSAIDNKRADPSLLAGLAERVLTFWTIEPSAVGMVVADADHRARPMQELMGFVSGAMPQLDDTADVINSGVATGNCDAVPFITALALAHHHTLERNAPVLCISNEDPARRFAVLIRPAVTRSET